MIEEIGKAAWGGAFDAFGKVFERLKANSQPAVLVMVLYALLTFTLLHASSEASASVSEATRAALIDLLFFAVLLLALPTYGLALASGRAISIGEFFRFDAKKYFSILGAGILYGLAVAGALLLLIVPAIWVAAWFALYQITVIDKNLGPIAALKESKRLIRGHIGKVWGIFGVSILLSIGASLLGFVPVIGDLLSAGASMFVGILSGAAIARLYIWAKAK